MHPPAFISSFLSVSLARGTPARTPARCSRRRAPRAAADGLSAVAASVSANPAALESVARAFKTLDMPDWLVQWGHPAMMGFMVAGMGVPGAAFGWAGRTNGNKKEGVAQKRTHESVMLAFLLLAGLGGLGGTLSVAMQGYDVWTTAHAKSAAVILGLLLASAAYAYTGFALGTDGSPRARLQGRTIHAWFGTAVMSLFALHAYLGVKILIE
jgi:hypothetical protein